MKRLGLILKVFTYSNLRGIEHLVLEKITQETADMLKSQSEIDATMVDSSYVLIKVFIWAIPILGFIGTVLGIRRQCLASEVDRSCCRY